MNIKYLIKELKLLKTKYCIRTIYLFGSQKDNEILKKDSDIDLLLLFRRPISLRVQRLIRGDLKKMFSEFTFDLTSLTEHEFETNEILFQGKFKEVKRSEFDDAIKI